MYMSFLIQLLPLIMALVPIVIKVVADMEDTYKDIKSGSVKKSKAMGIINDILSAGGLFAPIFERNKGGVLDVASSLIDMVVRFANLTGVFQTTTKIDYRPENTE
jgi:hypothetical protein